MFAIAVMAVPLTAVAKPEDLRPPGERGPISPAEDFWGRLVTLLKDPATPLTRKTVEQALGVKLKLDPTVGNGSNVFRLPTPARWPILLSLAQNITLVEHGALVPQMTSLDMGWDGSDKRYRLGQPYCVLKSEFESRLKKYGWTTDTSLSARLSSIAMDAPIMGAEWRRGRATIDLSSRISPDCLGSVTVDEPVNGGGK